MNYLKLAASLGVIALVAAAYLWVDHTGYARGCKEIKADWDAERVKIAQELLDSAVKNQKTINTLEETKRANLKTIGNLRNDIAGFSVRVPSTPCVGTPSADGGISDHPSTGAQPISTQEAFNDFKRGLESDAAEADALTEDCRVVMDWAKSLKK